MRVVSPEQTAYHTTTATTTSSPSPGGPHGATTTTITGVREKASMRSLVFDHSLSTTTAPLHSPGRLHDPHYQAAVVLLDEHLRWQDYCSSTAATSPQHHNSNGSNNNNGRDNWNNEQPVSFQHQNQGCCIMPHAGLRELMGDFGVTLFNPLNLTPEEIRHQADEQRNSRNSISHDDDEQQQQHIRHHHELLSPLPATPSTSTLPSSSLLFSSPTQTNIVWDDVPEESAIIENRQGARKNININNNPLVARSLDSCANLTVDTQVTTSTVATTTNDALLLAVDLDYESPADLDSCPRILTPRMMQQLHEDGIPESLQQCRWDRCFAIGRDGDSYRTLIEKAAGYQRTFVVIQTVEGYVLGGFATMPWKKQSGSNACYYGTGQSFLFASHPQVERPDDSTTQAEEEKPLQIYRWTGHNDFCQICDDETGRLGMGGGTDFGFLCQDNFWRGRSGASRTFGNPSLVPEGESFEIEALEVYGLRSFGESVSAFSASFMMSTTSTTSMMTFSSTSTSASSSPAASPPRSSSSGK